ncbi:hypothetical protein P7C73_g3456, partial [Tremellales sp. Uapishka_1]
MTHRRIQQQWSKYRPSPNDANPYANNPPPPETATVNNNGSNYSGNPYGNNPPPPQATYQPSMAGNYGNSGNPPEQNHEHGYEWEQAREEERLAREGSGANEEAPPGYNVAASGKPSYAPPPGAPPKGLGRVV